MKSVFAALLLLAGLATASAQTSSVPALLSYQGHVTDSAGNPIGSSTPVNRTVTFKFYSTSSGGSPVYAEAQTVTISGGDFSVLIGNGTGVSGLPGPGAPALTPYLTLPSIAHGDLYLGITVDDGTAAADPEIAPRQQIVSAAYAFRAKVAEALADGALSTAMLADTAVTTNKIGSAQVTTAKIADANIVTAKIADANITTAKLGDASVTAAKLANNAVTTAKIAANAITSDKIADGAVTTADIADGTIRSVDIGDGQVATVDLADAAVTGVKLANGAVDLNKLVAAVQQSLCPPGSILPFAGDTAPPGWLLCNGGAVSRSTYSALFNIVGTRFGTTASDNFRVPDLRGRFLRGRDGGAGRDPDRSSRTAMNSGGATGDAVGTVQSDQLRSHTHGYYDIYWSQGGGQTAVPNGYGHKGDEDNSNTGWQFQRTSLAAGGAETRPQNASVNYIIKY